MRSYVHWPVFIVSFIVGWFGVMAFVDDKKTLVIYPSTDGAQKQPVYQDHAGQCYSWIPKKSSSCPLAPAMFPLQ